MSQAGGGWQPSGVTGQNPPTAFQQMIDLAQRKAHWMQASSLAKAARQGCDVSVLWRKDHLPISPLGRRLRTQRFTTNTDLRCTLREKGGRLVAQVSFQSREIVIGQ